MSDPEGNVTELPILKVKLAWENRLGLVEVAGLMVVDEEAGAEKDLASSGTGGLLSEG